MRSIRRLRAYPGYVGDLFRYLRSHGPEPWSSISLRPMLDDKTSRTGFDAHYVYLGAWAFRQIVTHRPERHVDVGAQIGWVTCLASITQVVFLDVRPFPGSVENLQSQAGDVLALPFSDRELSSVSCLHVAEHIGLGRYGDAIDPLGTRKAIGELARVLGVGGRLNVDRTSAGRARQPNVSVRRRSPARPGAQCPAQAGHLLVCARCGSGLRVACPEYPGSLRYAGGGRGAKRSRHEGDPAGPLSTAPAIQDRIRLDLDS